MSFYQFMIKESIEPAGSFETFVHHEIKERRYTDAIEIGISSGGWYWQCCWPGCLPDGEPSGPFKTEAEAIADANSF